MRLVTTGTLLDSIPVVVLFDSGSTYAFIAIIFAPSIGVGLEDLGYDLVVTTPIGAVFITGQCVRGVVVTIC